MDKIHPAKYLGTMVHFFIFMVVFLLKTNCFLEGLELVRIPLSEATSRSNQLIQKNELTFVCGTLRDNGYDRASLWKIKTDGSKQLFFLGNENENSEAIALTIDQDVIYVTGKSVKEGFFAATLWKIYINGEKESLLLGEENESSEGQNIVVESGEVYVLGFVDLEGKTQATLWKIDKEGNKDTKTLGEDGKVSEAYDLAVSRGRAYACGIQRNEDDEDIATLWEVKVNGDKRALSLPYELKNSSAKRVVIAEEIAFVCGFENFDDINLALLWMISDEGSVSQILLGNSLNSEARGLVVEEDIIYVCGYENHENNSLEYSTSTLWRVFPNKQVKTISLGPQAINSEGYDIYVNRGEVYISGVQFLETIDSQFEPFATLWKFYEKGVSTTGLGIPNYGSFPTSIEAQNSIVYVCGNQNKIQGNPNETIATLWKWIDWTQLVIQGLIKYDPIKFQ